ncbi:3-oxoacyl [Sphaceloma murrayae]|uniref:3-oxoacyl n=1 Tax=Sphaceloma murrayae TaxID=2082308 RepID=A0A2K1QH28_9PEZI|nr:3-oxoacyl [Sphaceloma murrayae]
MLDIDYTDERALKGAARDYGNNPLDCLVNCAGFGVNPDDSWSYDADMVLESFKVMTLGLFLATKYFKPQLELSESIAGNNDEGENIGYRMAKAALNQQTKTLAQELTRAGSKIRLLAVCPGFIATKMTNFRGKDDIVKSCEGIVNMVLGLSAEDSGSLKKWNGNTTW